MQKKKIVHVDDVKTEHTILKCFLELEMPDQSHEYELVQFSDLETAEAYLREHGTDVGILILDGNIKPNGYGPDFVPQGKELCPYAKIVVYSYPTEERQTLQDGLRMGADAALMKKTEGPQVLVTWIKEHWRESAS
jgi:DNA-binding NarL/FixJ family response regulator